MENNNNPVGDYFYVNEEEIRRIHEREVMEGNPFVSGSMAGMHYLTKPSYLGYAYSGLPYIKIDERSSKSKM